MALLEIAALLSIAAATAGGQADPARPLVLDVGCNDGVLLAAIAGRHIHIDFVGLDWSPRLLYHAAGRVKGEKNVALVHARAELIGEIFGPGELDEIWLFQPEPMQLTTRVPTRLFDEPFLVACAGVLKAGGRLTLKTDHPGYYQWAAALLGAEPDARLAAQMRGEAKAKRKEFVDSGELPEPNAVVRGMFDISVNAADYWGDPGAQEATRGRAYFGAESTYEMRFKSKRLPIYLVELVRR